MNQPTFAVTRFENRNGVISWRVDGRLHGVRIRKNFKSREEAIAEKAAHELKALQADAGLPVCNDAPFRGALRKPETAFIGGDFVIRGRRVHDVGAIVHR